MPKAPMGFEFIDYQTDRQWTVGGYCFFDGALYYTCYDKNGRENDIYWEDVECHL